MGGLRSSVVFLDEQGVGGVGVQEGQGEGGDVVDGAGAGGLVHDACGERALSVGVEAGHQRGYLGRRAGTEVFGLSSGSDGS